MVLGIIVLCGAFVAMHGGRSSVAPPRDLRAPTSFCGTACTLVVEPDDGIGTVFRMIADARHSLALAEYALDDPAVIAALGNAAARGVTVRVMLDPSPSYNRNAFDALRAAGVPVRWAPAAFAYTHEKAMVADGARLFVMTFNLVPRYYPTGRDFGIIDEDAADAAAMEAVFDADWGGGPPSSAAARGHDLVWSPGARVTMLGLIDTATRTLDIYNEELADIVVRAALVRAARRGVAVRVVMTYAPEWHDAFAALADAGAHVRVFPDAPRGRYIHAKMIVADGVRAFVGSENFSATSLDRNRELGVRVDDPAVILRLMRTFAADAAAAEPFRS